MATYRNFSFLIISVIIKYWIIISGDVCKQTDKGNWKCTRIQNCPSAFASLRDNKRPELCRYNGFTAIVCCEPSVAPVSPPKNNRTRPKPPTNNKKPPPKGFKSISEQSKYFLKFILSLARFIYLDGLS